MASNPQSPGLGLEVNDPKTQEISRNELTPSGQPAGSDAVPELPSGLPSAGLIKILEDSIEDLRALINCRVCVRPMYEPYMIACGHSFCYSCLTSWFSTHRDNKTCPDCRARVTQTPAPAYVLREMTQLFISRAELMPAGETTHEHKLAQLEESKLIEKDKANRDRKSGGLFKGCFKPKNLPRPIGPIVDISDGVIRCPLCAWELDDNWCDRCQRTIYSDFGDESASPPYSDFSDILSIYSPDGSQHPVEEEQEDASVDGIGLPVGGTRRRGAGQNRTSALSMDGTHDDEDTDNVAGLSSDEASNMSEDSAGSLEDFVEPDDPYVRTSPPFRTHPLHPEPRRLHHGPSSSLYDRGYSEESDSEGDDSEDGRFTSALNHRNRDVRYTIEEIRRQRRIQRRLDDSEDEESSDDPASSVGVSSVSEASVPAPIRSRKRRRVVDDDDSANDLGNLASESERSRPRRRITSSSASDTVGRQSQSVDSMNNGDAVDQPSHSLMTRLRMPESTSSLSRVRTKTDTNQIVNPSGRQAISSPSQSSRNARPRTTISESPSVSPGLDAPLSDEGEGEEAEDENEDDTIGLANSSPGNHRNTRPFGYIVMNPTRNSLW